MIEPLFKSIPARSMYITESLTTYAGVSILYVPESVLVVRSVDSRASDISSAEYSNLVGLPLASVRS